MYQQIKTEAETALQLQNKNEMEAALKRIVAMCDESQAKAAKYAPTLTAAHVEIDAEVLSKPVKKGWGK